VSDDPDHQPRCPFLKIENLAKNQIKIFSSKTTLPFETKPWWNGPIGLLVSEEKIFKHISHRVLC
jgi:hypothetical protein